MSDRPASLGMYDGVPLRAANDALWQAIAQRLRGAGTKDVPATLDRTRPLAAIWNDPALLLAQTCGYPLMTAWRRRLRYVATPRYSVAGCDGAFHGSRIIVRHDDEATSLIELRNRRAAINDAASNTGMNLFRAAISPHAGGQAFFSHVIESGSHRESAGLVASGMADVAAIDTISYAQLERHEPALTDRLRTLTWTATAPGLPLVTSLRTSRRDLALIRDALGDVLRNPDLGATRDALMLDGFEILHAARYRRVLALERSAGRANYPALA
jgi:ABC-type phosphate/phosphonate transport system substrate-binding protein